MCYYSRWLSASPDPTVSCDGGPGTSQDGTFAGGAYGSANDNYWSSSQFGAGLACLQNFDDGSQSYDVENASLRVRPVRAF